MRIAQVSPLYESVPPSRYGGTERVVSYLTEELVALGHGVTLFASGDSRTAARLVPGCPRALRLHPVFKDPLVPHMIMHERVVKMAASRAFDVVHFHTDYPCFPVARRVPAPCVVTIHGRLDVPDLKLVYREFAEVPLISISDAQRRAQARANWVATVYHGLPRRLCRLHEEHRGYLAFLGRVSREKRLDLAIRIAEMAGMELLIAAKVDEADREYFEAEIKGLLTGQGVKFIGEIGEDQKSDFLGGAAAMLFPIDWPEPFGLVMIESMACGTPVIAYPRGSVPEVIDEGVTGFVVGSVEEAAGAVRKVMGGFDRVACRAKFEERFTAARMARDYVQVYQRMIDEGSRGPEVERAGPGRTDSASAGRAAVKGDATGLGKTAWTR
jgi:glycosyltransferase involved in cell wall biosynthesis